MPDRSSTPFDVAELERRLLAVDSAVVLTPPRVLRRIIKHDCKLPGLGLQVPHRKTYVIDRDKALAIASRDELGLQAERVLPEALILIAKPTNERLAATPTGVNLVKYWRLLFHARVHIALAERWEARTQPARDSSKERSAATLSEADVRRRIHQIGSAEFDEARTVLRQEHFLLPPYDARTVYQEFAALYLELRHFAPGLLPRYFPALEDLARIDRIFAQELDAPALLRATRLEGAPDPATLEAHETESDDEEHAGPPLSPAEATSQFGATPSEARTRRLLRHADRALALGNVVRSAVLRERAAAASPADRAPGIRADARTDLERLAHRLQAALGLIDREAEDWRQALPALLDRAAQGIWPVEARLLYDLQKVCVENERGVFSVDVVAWAVSLGRRPLRRPLSGMRYELTSKHLRKALRRLPSARLDDEHRHTLATLLKSAVHGAEERLRVHFRPQIRTALAAVGIRPANMPERIAFAKLTEELLDRVNEQGRVTMSDLRDAISRNQVKLPDLAGTQELLQGDSLIRANRKLPDVLQGIYRRGEIYLRWLQRMSAVAFGTAAGRWLTRFVVLPFGGAFAALFAVEEVVGLVLKGLHHVGETAAAADLGDEVAPPTPEHDSLGLTNPYSVGILGVALLLLLQVPAFRRHTVEILLRIAKAFKTVLYDWPTAIIRKPAVQWLLNSRPVVLALHYVIKPLAPAVLAAVTCRLAGANSATVWESLIGMFLLATLFLNTRLGREVQEAAADWYVRGWRYLWLELIPGVIRLSLDVFRTALEAIERLLYTVDEWLRFREGEGRLSLLVKPVLGFVWSLIRYVIRVVLNLFVEPTFNPVKHFPTVTVAAKLITPMMIVMRPQMVEAIAPLVGLWLANGLVVLSIGLAPGLAGFLVWEFKENWKLYAANRSRFLRAVAIGHHGETMLRLLKPGFHSGAVPKIYAQMRRASRQAMKTGDWRTFRKRREALFGIVEALRHFLEREFLALLEESRCWRGPEVTVELIRLGTNRIRVKLGCPDLSDKDLVLHFEEQSGWLTARIAEPGWLPRLNNEQRRVLVNALLGLYKLAGIHLIHEQIQADLGPDLAYDATVDGLAVFPANTFDAKAAYDLSLGPTLTPRLLSGKFRREPPVLSAIPFVFSRTSVTWSKWVEAWEKDESGKGHPKSIIHGVHLLPI